MRLSPKTSNTLLSYSLSTTPDPLQASPSAANTVYGALTFVVSNNTNKIISLSKLQFTFTPGLDSAQLTNDPGNMHYASNPAGLWDIKMTSPGVFLALPTSGNPVQVTTDGFVIEFFNIAINQKIGVVQVPVDETANFANEQPTLRTATFEFAKFPYGFFFGNFTAQVPMVTDGTKVTLTWNGSDDANYMIYWGHDPVPVTNVRTWTTPTGITTDTTFLIRATVVSQGETVTRDLSTTVIVANPELHATSLQVTGITNLQGTTTTKALTVNDQFTAANGASFTKTLESTGTATFGTLTATKEITASGGISTSQITASQVVTGTAVVAKGNFSSGDTATLTNVIVRGTVNMFQGPQQLSTSERSYTVKTDGFVIVYATTYQATGSPAGYNWGALAVNYTLGLFAAGAANYYFYAGTYTTGMSQLAVPVKAGATFSIKPYTSPSYPPPIFVAWWVPFGYSGSIGESIREATDAEIETLSPFPPIEDFLTTPEQQQERAVESLLETLQNASAEKKAAIASALGLK
ncbi:MAG: hypothetical protein WCF67_15785 [Chitinophagaceae bacterium]